MSVVHRQISYALVSADPANQDTPMVQPALVSTGAACTPTGASGLLGCLALARRDVFEGRAAEDLAEKKAQSRRKIMEDSGLGMPRVWVHSRRVDLTSAYKDEPVVRPVARCLEGAGCGSINPSLALPGPWARCSR